MNCQKKEYIAVTIGPIFDTMSLVSTPAALWVSSYMFSCITKTICDLLLKNGVKEERIITPYYSETDKALFDKNDGVGLFHDHIIFEADGFNIDEFDSIKEDTLGKISADFGLEGDYLKKYVQIAAVKFEAENPIMGCEHMLNSRELEKPFVANNRDQSLLKLLFSTDSESGDQAGKNNKIKIIANNLHIFDNWQLRRGTDIKTLEMIIDPYYQQKAEKDKAKKNKDENKKTPVMKKHRYYAIIRSDGDNISKIIKTLQDKVDSEETADGEKLDRSFRGFSKTCLEYCAEIAETVKKFDGVTIYAGGDDLLAILPCENKVGKTPFEFIQRANEIFAGKFKPYNPDTSLSFGITMCYYKFPLYEALDDSAYLLFDVAKDSKRKNCAVVRLQKHAGQSEGLVIPNAALEEFLNLKNVIVKPGVPVQQGKDDENKDERVIVSALHKLSLFEPLLKVARAEAEKTKKTLTQEAEEAVKKAFENATEEEKQKAIEAAKEKAAEEASAQYRENIVTLFGNIFDAKEQKSTFLQKTLPDFYHKLETSLKIDAMTNEGVQNNSVTDLAYILRMLKFFNEKAGDKE